MKLAIDDGYRTIIGSQVKQRLFDKNTITKIFLSIRRIKQPELRKTVKKRKFLQDNLIVTSLLDTHNKVFSEKLL